MLYLPCPWCGHRDEAEFLYGGEADRRRPHDLAELDDEAFADYLYNSTNALGPVREVWWHQRGCGSWFTLVRDTANHAIDTEEGA